MFLDNKYTRWYYALMNKARSENRRRTHAWQYNRHHEIPKSMGGKEGNNLVLLTPREHYIAHLLLTRMTEGKMKRNMVYAFLFFVRKGTPIKSSIFYLRRIEFLRSMPGFFKGKSHTSEAKEKTRKANLGKTVSEETRRKKSASLKGREITWGSKISVAKSGKPVSDEVKQMRREQMTGTVASETTRAKMRASGLKAWERRRAANMGDRS